MAGLEPFADDTCHHRRITTKPARDERQVSGIILELNNLHRTGVFETERLRKFHYRCQRLARVT